MSSEKQAIVDPVCKMQLRREQIRESLGVDGQSYYSWSVGCRAMATVLVLAGIHPTSVRLHVFSLALLRHGAMLPARNTRT